MVKTVKATSLHLKVAVRPMKKMGLALEVKPPRDGEGQDGGSSDLESSGGGEITDAAEPEEDHDEETEGTSRETEESDSESSSSYSKTHGEIPAQPTSLVKKTKGGTSMKETKIGNPNSSQTPSLPNFNSKDTEEEQKVQRHKDAQLLDKNCSKWCDCMISESNADWKKHDTMTSNQRDPCKELKYPDPAGPPLVYMKHCRVFKAKKTNEYDLVASIELNFFETFQSFPLPLSLPPAQC